MIYKKFKELELSALGFGTMRLPLNSEDDGDVNQAQVDDMVKYALDHGINYFDTAYGYHNGQSEVAIGKALAKYPRDSYYLTTKFPGYDVSNMDKVEAIFEEQLQKCSVEYFDFYLFHNVYEKNIDYYLDEKYGILEYLLKQKENGRIKHLGFSAHGSYEVMKRFLDAYGKHMEFCQIQLNYLDWDFQDAKKKVQLLKEHNLLVWVMEPLRGGRLAKLAPEQEATLKTLRPEEEIPAWAFRFLQTIPGVTMVLSGMSNMDQMVANIKTYEEDKPLDTKEWDAILDIASQMVSDKILPCTACRYCTSHCPKGLNIPELLALYNEHKFTGGGFIAPMAIGALPEDKRPSACVGCKSCEAVCPQMIKISEVMKEFDEMVGSGF